MALLCGVGVRSPDFTSGACGGGDEVVALLCCVGVRFGDFTLGAGAERRPRVEMVSRDGRRREILVEEN